MAEGVEILEKYGVFMPEHRSLAEGVMKNVGHFC
jgi:hypothetical protein